jgi:alkylation response protein AidB-like acyl-CoA dehydrogenase
VTTTHRTPPTGAPQTDASTADAARASSAGDVQVSYQQAREVAEAARETAWRKPSFGKELFGGRLRLDLVDPLPTPDPADTARAEEFLTRLREFASTRVDGRRIERDARIPDDVLAGLADLGAFGMKIDQRYGGVGLSNLHYCRALTLAGSASPAVGALLSAHQSIGVPQPLKLLGTEEQKQRFLTRLAAGEVSAFYLTESDVGSDPARMSTTAEPLPDGSGYRLNGVKLWATNGILATLLVVVARVPRSEGHRGGITAFVVEGDAPGVTVERRNAFMGLRGLENSVTRFHDVFVPAENRIGEEGQGLRIALTTLNTGRLSLGASCVGAAKWCLAVAKDWARERVQMGRPIGQHEEVAKKIAFIAASAYGMESMLDLSCLLADDDRNDIRIESALVKLYMSELAWRVADELVQVRGGRGYETAESLAARGERPIGAEQLLRDLRINRIFEGTTEIMHLLIAREAVDAHLSVAGDLIDPKAGAGRKARALLRASGFYARWLPTLLVGRGQLPGAYGEFGPLATHLRWAERRSRKLARATFRAMARWQGRLERKQAFLARLVEIGAELYAITATCVRAKAERDTRPEGLELADAFCRQARLRAEAHFRALWRNTDDADRKLTRRVAEGRYEFLEAGILPPPTDGEWVAGWEPGPSTAQEDVRRRIPRLTPTAPTAPSGS